MHLIWKNKTFPFCKKAFYKKPQIMYNYTYNHTKSVTNRIDIGRLICCGEKIVFNLLFSIILFPDTFSLVYVEN